MNEILKKRIEEAQVEFANKEYEVGDIDWDALYKGFFHGAEYAISHQWIKVEEALPNNQDYVIAGYEDNIFKALYCKTNNMWLDTCGFERDVDRWMPIPKNE